MCLRPLVAAALATTLAGCAVVPRLPAGSVQVVSTPAGPARAPSAVVMSQSGVADDAVRHLLAWYAPGPTRWRLGAPVQDEFGGLLVERLRRVGYAVQEYAPARHRGTASQGVPLTFVFERVDGDIHRLTLRAGTRSLSRAYLERDGRMLPVGAWAHGE